MYYYYKNACKIKKIYIYYKNKNNTKIESQ